MASKLYSSEMMQLVAQANRRMSQERARQNAGGTAATEAGAVALHYAQRELDRIYGYNAGVEKLTLSGVTDPAQIEKIMDAAERITGSKMLTAAGRKEAQQKAAASFFNTDRGKLTAKQMKVWRGLTESSSGLAPAFDRLKENAGGYAAGSIKDAVQVMSDNGLTGQQITDAINNYISENQGKQDAESIYDYLADTYPDMDWTPTDDNEQ